MRRIPGLDGIRGVAILSVVAYHATRGQVIVGGYFGVDLFFVLSGFLITSLLRDEWETHGAISLRGFWTRRARRLLPGLVLYLGTLAVLGVAAVVAGRTSLSFVAGTAAASVYTTNFVAAFNGLGGSAHWIGGLWSLAAEEQFYLVWPFALIVLLRRGGAKRALVAVLALSIIGFVGVAATSDIYQLQYNPLARSVAIVAGCLLAFVPLSFRGGLSLGGALFAIACLLGLNAPHTIVIFTPFAIVGAMLLVGNATQARGLAWPPLMWFGTISYSLYLWHPFFLRLLPTDRLLAVALSIGVAAASTYWLEAPIRSRRHRTRRDTIVSSLPAAVRSHP